MENCTKCGVSLGNGENFCPQCGTPQETDPSYFEVEDYADGCRIKKYTGPNEGAVVIPSCIGGKKVVEIGDEAFFDYRGLTSITIPDSVMVIDRCAFAFCTSLASVTIPDSVTAINMGAFVFCESLASVTIPNSITEFGAQAFLNCESLISITIPDSVTEFGMGALENCYQLTIHAPAGSAAEQYAKDYDIPFQPL